MAARYSRVERRVWRDEKFRQLGRDARLLWLYLLTCDAHGGFPGLFLLRLASAADDLHSDDDPWTPGRVVMAFAKIAHAGMARRDETTGVVWLPRALSRHERMMANHARGWRSAWDELPDCALSREAFVSAVRSLSSETNGAALVAAFTDRAPAWWNQRDIGSPCPAPAQPLPSPFAAGTGTGTGTGTGEEGDCPPAPKVSLSEFGRWLFSDLVDDRDLILPSASDDEIAACAAAMAKHVAAVSGDRAHGGPYLTETLAWAVKEVSGWEGKGTSWRVGQLLWKFRLRVSDDAPSDYARGRTAVDSLQALTGAA